jgi:hypothetical protein
LHHAHTPQNSREAIGLATATNVGNCPHVVRPNVSNCGRSLIRAMRANRENSRFRTIATSV